MTVEPIRLPDARHRRGRARTSGGVVGRCPARPALNKAFPGFACTVVTIDDSYWCNPHAVIAADGTRCGDDRAWVERQLAELTAISPPSGTGIARTGRSSPNGAAPASRRPAARCMARQHGCQMLAHYGYKVVFSG